jgi:hypothetical protein
MVSAFLKAPITWAFWNPQSILVSFEVWSFRSDEGQRGVTSFYELQKHPGLNVILSVAGDSEGNLQLRLVAIRSI